MRRILTLLFCVHAGMAMGDVKLPSGKVQDCYCTDSTGGRVELGQVICLRVDGRNFMARCEMALNNPFWREVQQGCATSSLDNLPQSSPSEPKTTAG